MHTICFVVFKIPSENFKQLNQDSFLRESDYVITHLTFGWQYHLMASMKCSAHYVKQCTQMKNALLRLQLLM